MRYLRSFLVASALVASCVSFAEVKSADALMNEAFAKAKSESKAVFLSFKASWCGWCHKLEDFLKKPEIKAIWDKRVVTVWLTVQESQADKKPLMNPGGDAWLKRYGGDSEGIPFSIVFDGNGKALIDSKLDGKKSGNIGYPAKDFEIAWFMKMLDKVTAMTAEEKKAIKEALVTEGAKIGG